MSVEKLSDSSRSIIEQNPYAQIINNVIENIKDNDAFRLYCFLISKSRDWRVIKSYAARICGVSERKAKQCFAYLNRCKLIEYVWFKDHLGRVIRADIMVLNGTKFDKNVEFLINEPVQMSTGAETARVETGTCGERTPTKERYNQRNNEPINISCSSGDELQIETPKFKSKKRPGKVEVDSESLVLFTAFWLLYPRKQKKAEALKIWLRKGLDTQYKAIEENLNARISGEWKDKSKEFIPLPSSYLNGSRWEDEIIQNLPPKSNVATISPIGSRVVAGHIRNEPKCTVPDYGPGHPTWEANQKWEEERRKRMQ